MRTSIVPAFFMKIVLRQIQENTNWTELNASKYRLWMLMSREHSMSCIRHFKVLKYNLYYFLIH